MEEKRIFPPKSWDNENHFMQTLEDKWYFHIAEIENLVSKYTNLFYDKNGFKTLYLPVTSGSVSSPMGLGSDSLPVKTTIQGVPTYLCDSMQFYLEYGTRLLKSGVYYIMPSFRGESEDERHLSQFFHSETEIQGNLEDVMKLAEEYIKYISKNILNDYSQEIVKLAGTVNHIENIISKKEFPQVTFEEACKILDNSEKYIEFHNEGFRTINSLGEKKLIEYFNGIVWLKNFETISVPFYQATMSDIRYAKNADLLFGIGETLGAGERHETGDEVRNSLHMHNVQEDEYSWYIEMKDKYPLKTSGYGMGIERFILWLTNNTDIRDCQLIPRFNGKKITV